MMAFHCSYYIAVKVLWFMVHTAGLKVDFNLITDAMEANALGHENFYIDIYSSSWGPSDYGFSVEGPGTLLQPTLATGVRVVCTYSPTLDHQLKPKYNLCVSSS